MSLDKAIKSGREKRQPYRKSKAIDSSCRNHGSCPACQENRKFSLTKKIMTLKEKEDDLRT